MTFYQIFLFSLLGAVFGLFMWGKLRHDLVAVLALLAATLAGQVTMSGTFAGFASPATVTVALVLIVSRGLVNSGAVNIIDGACFRRWNRQLPMSTRSPVSPAPCRLS